jgi:predicted dehydrogenase
MSLIAPSKSHPEVIIQAVAARDRQRAEKFAKSNGIPEVKNSYQGESTIMAVEGILLKRE